MLTIEKNTYTQLELLLDVLCGEKSEKDPEFQCWLDQDVENRKLYCILKSSKRGQIKHSLLNKDQVFDNISYILGLNIQTKKHFYQHIWVKYVVSLIFVAIMSFSGYYTYTKYMHRHSNEFFLSEDLIENPFDQDTKKVYMVSSQGKVFDLSEEFEIRQKDGTVISNKSEGFVSFQHAEETANNEVESHTIYVPKGDVYELLLSDNTKVFLNADTKFVFPSKFSGATRQVELIGEAYFSVKKDESPFIVKTAEMQITVTGTAFNVNAYQDNTSIHTTLVEGNVQINVPNKPETYTLSSGNNFSINKYSDEISIQKVNTDNYTAWMRGEYVFSNQPLDEILITLKRWYDVEIEYEKPAIKTMRFTGSVEKKRPLNDFLHRIQIVTEINCRNEGDKIILY